VSVSKYIGIYKNTNKLFNERPFFFRNFNLDASDSEKERESQLPVGRWNGKVGAIQLTRAIGHEK